MGAKKTSDLIPLCHPLPISKVAIELTPDTTLPGVRIHATVKTTGQTGVEMEALSAVSITALTIYDMAKAVDKAMEIGGIHVVLKMAENQGVMRCYECKRSIIATVFYGWSSGRNANCRGFQLDRPCS